MKGIVEEYGTVVMSALVGGGVLGIGYWLLSALSPLVDNYILVIG